MTDQDEMPEPQWDAAVAALPAPGPVVSYPDASARPSRENHLITISITPNKAPMVVVRGDSAEEILGLFEELENGGVYIQMAAAEQALKGSTPPAEMVMQQLGATVVAQQPGVAPWDQPGIAGPPVPSAGPPPFGAPMGGYQQPAQPSWGAPAGPAPLAPPPGWFRVKIPYAQKAAGDAIIAQVKAANMYRDHMKWDKATKTWLVSPQVAQGFAQWGPSPA